MQATIALFFSACYLFTMQQETPKQLNDEIFADILAIHCTGQPVSTLLPIFYPDISTGQFWRYAGATSDRVKSLALARECFSHSLMDETISIADTTRDPQMARNRIMARHALAARFMPKQYSEKISVDVEQKVDISVAIMAARERIASRQLIDVTPDAQAIEIDPFS